MDKKLGNVLLLLSLFFLSCSHEKSNLSSLLARDIASSSEQDCHTLVSSIVEHGKSLRPKAIDSFVQSVDDSFRLDDVIVWKSKQYRQLKYNRMVYDPNQGDYRFKILGQWLGKKLANSMGIEVDEVNYLALKSSDNKLYYYVEVNPELKKGDFSFEENEEKDFIFNKLKLINVILSENSSFEILKKQNGGGAHYFVRNHFSVDKDKIDEEIVFSKVIDIFSTEQSIKEVISSLRSFNFEELDNILSELEIGLDVSFAIKKRIEVVREALDAFNFKDINTLSDLDLKFLKIRQKYKKKIDRKKIAFLRESIKSKFEKDFLRNTTFRTFDEYKEFIWAIPEYRSFINSFEDQYEIRISSPKGNRNSILSLGFLNGHEVQNSTQNEAGYFETRLASEADMLGMDLEQYKLQIKKEYRPVSAYLQIVKKDQTEHYPDKQYGGDNYIISIKQLKKEMEKGNALLTFTLGDSMRSSLDWYGRPVLLEDFPYLAAPFIEQYNRANHLQNYPGVLNYRQNISGLNDTVPNFLNELEDKFKFQLRSHATFAESYSTQSTSKHSGDYVEAQMYGDLSFKEIVERFVPDQSAPVNSLQSEYLKSKKIELVD